MSAERLYILDSDVLITAKNLYYAFDLCPGFWESLIHYHGQGRLFSIDRVRGELLAGHKTEDLVQWVQDDLPRALFLSVDTDAVTRAYTEIMMWAQRHSNYFDHAKAKFATGADGWLVAYARVHAASVVTNEQPAPKSRKAIKLPDVCDQFAVKRENTFSMLRTLGARFDWTGES